MKSKLLLTLTLLAVIATAFRPKPTEYVVDSKKSTLVWTAKKVTGSHTGNITLSSGSLQIEGSALKGGSFEIDMSTITDTDLKNEKDRNKLVKDLKNKDFFDVEKFPTAKMDILSAAAKGGNNYDIKGNLTIKGITQPIQFPATFVINGASANATAKVTVDRTKYDIKYRSGSFFENLGDKVIYDDFELNVSLVANQK